MGVISALLKFGGLNLEAESWLASNGSQWLGIVMFIALCTYLYRTAIESQKRRINKKSPLVGNMWQGAFVNSIIS
jgi:hypothetical protein